MPTVFSSGATLNAEGQVVPVVDARPTPPALAADPAPEPTTPVVPDPAEGEQSPGDPAPAEPDVPDETEEDADEEREAQPLSRRQRRAYEARLIRENERLRQDLAREAAHREILARQLQQPGTPPQPATPAPVVPQGPPKPQAYEYQTQEAYIEAMATWVADTRDRQRDAQAAERANAEAQATAQQRWDTRLEEGRDKYEDFDDVITRAAAALHPNPSQPYSPVASVLVDTIRDSDAGADLFYYLGTHPKEIQHLRTLSPLAAARWLGQLEARLTPADGSARTASASSTPSRRVAPPAAPPMAPVGTGPVAPVGNFRNGMSLASYEAMRREERTRMGMRP